MVIGFHQCPLRTDIRDGKNGIGDTLSERLEIVLKVELNEGRNTDGNPLSPTLPRRRIASSRMWERRSRSFEVNPAAWMTDGINSKLDMALVA